jgi:hypothetical protein
MWPLRAEEALLVFLFHALNSGIHCARLPREAMFVALLRKVDTVLPRVSSQIGAVLCPAAKGFQCAVLFQLRRSCG